MPVAVFGLSAIGRLTSRSHVAGLRIFSLRITGLRVAGLTAETLLAAVPRVLLAGRFAARRLFKTLLLAGFFSAVFRIAAVFPIVAVILDLMAARRIHADQLLVESFSRLRSDKRRR